MKGKVLETSFFSFNFSHNDIEQSSPLTLDEERRNAVSDALLYSARDFGGFKLFSSYWIESDPLSLALLEH